MKEEIKPRKERRQEREKEAQKKGAAPAWPSGNDLRAEEEEEAPAVIFTISDSSGRVVRRLTGPVTAGMQRVSWDLRAPAPTLPPPPNPEGENPFDEGPAGPLVMAGTYKVSLAKRVDRVIRALGQA